MKKKIIIVAAILIVTAIAIFVINKTKPAGGAGFGGPGKGGRGGNITFTVRSAEAKVRFAFGFT